jgi:hypothetical protein
MIIMIRYSSLADLDKEQQEDDDGDDHLRFH